MQSIPRNTVEINGHDPQARVDTGRTSGFHPIFDAFHELLLSLPDAATMKVALYISERQNRPGSTGWAWPSAATIAKKCGISRSTVFRAISRLQEVGFIDQLKPGGYSVETGRNETTQYHVAARFRQGGGVTHATTPPSHQRDGGSVTGETGGSVTGGAQARTLRSKTQEQHHHQTSAGEELAAPTRSDGGGGSAAPEPERADPDPLPMTRQALGALGISPGRGRTCIDSLVAHLAKVCAGDDAMAVEVVGHHAAGTASAKSPPAALANRISALGADDARRAAHEWRANPANPRLQEERRQEARQEAEERRRQEQAIATQDRARREAEAERAEEQWAGVDDRRAWMMGLGGDMDLDVDQVRVLPIGESPFDTIGTLEAARDGRHLGHGDLGIWYSSNRKNGGTTWMTPRAATIGRLAEAGRIEAPPDIEEAIRSKSITARIPDAQQPAPRHRLPNPATDEPVPTQKIHQRAHAQREAIAV